MLRAPFKARPSYGDSHAIPSTRPTADLISDGGTPGSKMPDCDHIYTNYAKFLVVTETGFQK